MIEDGIGGKWPPGVSPEEAKEQIAHCNNRIQELKDLKLELGDQKSGKSWGKLKTHWQPSSKEFAERLKGLDSQLPLSDMHTSSWMMLNGYAHARSRELSPPTKLDGVMLQFLGAMFHINLAGIELNEKFSL